MREPTQLSDASGIVRTFRELTEEDAADIQRIAALLSPGMSGGIEWNELLASRRILIVAEAGAGKTYECRRQQERLWAAGEPAFFFELTTLANDDPRNLLDSDGERRFDAWLASQSDIATIFLDSIDELKLTLGSFEQALRRLNKALAGQLGRTRIVITTRPIAFDQQVIRRWLPASEASGEVYSAENFADIATGRSRPEPSEKPAPEWRNVGLMPLSDEQIRQMATIHAEHDVDGLIADIRRRNAEDFARRPQDLIELCADWNAAQRIRTHREQVAQNVAVKLLPRRREPAPLSAEKALEGARRLALAALLTRKLTIRHSAEADKGGPNELALNPATVLYDWTAPERETLLERPLFGFASYGRVRFHHRSVIEYLAADYLDALLADGMPVKAAKRLLFADTAQGESVVRPSMRPVAAWLAARRSAFFGEVLEREPEVLLDHGDPESLDINQRREALRAYVARYGAGGWRGLSVPFIQAHRFVSAELGGDVVALWRGGVENTEVRDLLLTLIEVGKLAEGEEIAFEVAIGDTKENVERCRAISALVALDSSKLVGVVEAVESDPIMWTDRLVRRVISYLFPKHLTVDRLCPLLMRVKEDRSSVGDLSWQLPRIIALPNFPNDILEPLRECLTRCVADEAVWTRDWPHISTNRPHLAPALAETCLKLLALGDRTPALLRSSMLALRFGKDNTSRGEPAHRLRGAIGNLNSADRAALFWIEDDFLQSLHPETRPWERLYTIIHGGAIEANVSKDEGWVMAQLADSGRASADRAMLLELAIRLRPHDVEWKDHGDNLKAAVADQPELTSKIEEYFKPRPEDTEERKWERDHERQTKKRKQEEAKAYASWLAFWTEVAQHPDRVFAEDRAYNTAWNLWRAMEAQGINSRSAGWNRRFIEGNFGKETADRLRVALMPIWRKDPPTLSRERKSAKRNTTYVRWELGLAGITAESEDPTWATKLSAQEADAAARHVPMKLDGFPSWLDALVSAHPNAVDRTLGEELTFDLSALAKAPHWFSSILENLRDATPTVVQLFLPRLRQWLDTHGGRLRKTEDITAASDRLRRVLEMLILYGDAATVDYVREMARQKMRRSGGKFERVWLPILLRLDPAAGVDALERVLSKIPSGAQVAVFGWFGSLFGDRHHPSQVDLSLSGFSPDLLLRLAKLAYTHIRIAEDAQHEGMFTPDARDHAERGRNVILGALMGTTGSAGWAAKLALAGDPLFAHFRDRAIAIAREKAAEEADGDALNDKQVADLNRNREAPPSTFEAMFSLLRDRLDDLDELLLEDVSPRESWAAITEERVMRREIARELRNRSNNNYTVDQEAATADEKETDVRLRALSGQQAVIELKIGEKPRSAAKLRDALKDQLVNKYMAADECRAGCLLITINSDRTWQHPDTGATLDLAALVAWLNLEAQHIVNSLGGIMRLCAKGLDLRPRLSTENKAHKIAAAAMV